MDTSSDASFEASESWDEDDLEVEGDLVEEYCSLFSSAVFPDLEGAVSHDLKTFGFDWLKFRHLMHLDEIENIMCINYIRAEVQQGDNVLQQLKVCLTDGSRPWKQDHFMRPVMENDGYLLHDWAETTMADSPSTSEKAPASSELEFLRRQNDALANAVQMLADYVPEELRSELVNNLDLDKNIDESSQQLGRLGFQTANDNPPSTSGRSQQTPQPLLRAARRRGSGRSDVISVDEKYFDSYSHYDIHREMLSDQARTWSYQQALEGNPELMRGASVMDVGCGTAILSMFAARAGASRVTGVDGSETIANTAKQICTVNRLESSQGGPISILAGRVEDLELPADKKVDVIVSEWMGYMLLFEAMLDSVLYARDRWLKVGGAVLPDLARMYVAGAQKSALGVSFWGDVYGFSMQPVADSILQASQGKAIIKEVAAGDIITKSQEIAGFDILTMTKQDADFNADFDLPLLGVDAVECHALVVWFDVEFSRRFCKNNPVLLSTSPSAKLTHWAQTVLPLRKPVSLDGASALKGRISVARSETHRSLDISLEYVDPRAPGDVHAFSYTLATT